MGDAAEPAALAHLQGFGLTLVRRNYRVARGPHARGGEIDLILRERDGTLVFVEVRRRMDATHGGAAASVGASKQRRLVLAARHFLAGMDPLPPCRFERRRDRWRASRVVARGVRCGLKRACCD